MTEWIENELATIDIGDKRLNERAKAILRGFHESIGNSIPDSFQTLKEVQACYRFFDNDMVHPSSILEPHINATLERIKAYKTVLLINDTTSLDYTKKKSIKNLGTLESDHCRGLFVHPTLAVTPQRVPLGIVKADIWVRNNPEKHRSLSSAARMNIPTEEKESYRWIESYQSACDIAQSHPETEIIHISDQEGDIFEIFSNAQEASKKGKYAALIVRSNHDRKLTGDEGEDKLRPLLMSRPSLGTIEFTLSARENKPSRQVTQSLRAAKVTLKGMRKAGKVLDEVTINAVMSREDHPPEGEDAICWVFLTTLPIASKEDVRKILEYYLCRWEIEVYFRTLKSGCQVEKRGLQQAVRIEAMLSIFLILAWRIHYVTQIGREHPKLCCTAIFETVEWQAVHMFMTRSGRLPENPPSIKELITQIARMGGYLNRKSDPPPGPTVMWRGLNRLAIVVSARECFKQFDNNTYA